MKKKKVAKVLHPVQAALEQISLIQKLDCVNLNLALSKVSASDPLREVADQALKIESIREKRDILTLIRTNKLNKMLKNKSLGDEFEQNQASHLVAFMDPEKQLSKESQRVASILSMDPKTAEKLRLENAEATFFGRNFQKFKAKAPLVHDNYLKSLHSKQMGDTGFDNLHDYQEARDLFMKYCKDTENEVMKKPATHPYKTKDGKPMNLALSYPQLLALENTDSQGHKAFEHLFGVQTKNIQTTFEESSKQACPLTQCQPFVKTSQILMPHLFSAWRAIVVNRCEFRLKMKKETDKEKLVAAYHEFSINAHKLDIYYLATMHKLIAASLPPSLSFNAAWGKFLDAQKFENNYPWRGTTKETELAKDKDKLRASPVLGSNSQDTIKKGIEARLANGISKSSDGTAITKNFWQ